MRRKSRILTIYYDHMAIYLEFSCLPKTSEASVGVRAELRFSDTTWVLKKTPQEILVNV